MLPSLADLTSSLGFPPLEQVSSLHSIAHQFPAAKPRTGIYLIVFGDGSAYIGQAVDVVRRLSQHRKVFDDITGFAFQAHLKADLDPIERDAIFRGGSLGLRLRNVVHAAQIDGERDLDEVVAPDEQDAWLASPLRRNLEDRSPRISLPEAASSRTRAKFERLLAHPLGLASIAVLRTYLLHCIPFPMRTELTFWSASCLPGTNRSTWPRLLAINAGVMELMVLGWDRDDPNTLWGFVNVATDELASAAMQTRTLQRRFAGVSFRRTEYRDAGQHQGAYQAVELAGMNALVGHPEVRRAASLLALRVMRKRATIYAKFHCEQLAVAALIP